MTECDTRKTGWEQIMKGSNVIHSKSASDFLKYEI